MAKGTCSEPSCNRPHVARGWCDAHYAKERRDGQFAPLSSTERFWAKVDRSDASGCWLWTGADDRHGYGQVRINYRLVGAHRFAYELLVGPIPSGLQIDHLCRVPLCVNPAHLEPVTRKENAQRGIGAQRTRERRAARTHCQRGHPFDEANTYIQKNGGRVCRTCKQLWKHAKRGISL